MKKTEVQVGKKYKAKFGNRMSVVKLIGTRLVKNTFRLKPRLQTAYDVEEVGTGKRRVFLSATKFREEVTEENKNKPS